MIEATVQVGAEETPYLRAGSGAGTVLLLARRPEDRLWMMRCAVGTCRLFAPAVPAPSNPRGISESGGAAGEWLRGVVEGLGLDRPAVVLAPDLGEWLVPLQNLGDVLGSIHVLGGDEAPAELGAALEMLAARATPGY